MENKIDGYEYHIRSEISNFNFIEDNRHKYDSFRFRNDLLNMEYECESNAIDRVIQYLISTPETLFERIFKRGERDKALNGLYKRLSDSQEEYFKKLDQLK